MTSNINPSLPEDNVPAVKADLRANLQAAKDEIEALQARQVPSGGGTGQVLKKLSSADFHFDWGTDEMGTGSGNFGDEVVLVDAQAGADDSAKISAALTAMNSTGKPLWFSKRQYTLTAKINVSQIHNWRIYGNGAVLKAADSLPIDNTAPGALFTIDRCTKWAIFDLVVDGNAHKSPSEAPGENAIRGTADNFNAHNFSVRSAVDYLFQNVHSINAPGDGWRVYTEAQGTPSTFPLRGRFLNCVADDIGRNGLSIIEAYDLDIIGCTFRRAVYRNPQSGIDFEPRSNTADLGIARVKIIGCTFEDNNHDGIHIVFPKPTGRMEDVLIKGCVFARNGGLPPGTGGTGQAHAPGVYVGAAGSYSIIDNIFVDMSGDTAQNTRGLCIFVGGMGSPKTVVLIEGNQIRNCSGTSSEGGLIRAHANNAGLELSVIGNMVDRGVGSAVGILTANAHAHVANNRVFGGQGSGHAIEMTGANSLAVGNYVRGTVSYGGSATVEIGNHTVGP